MSPDVQSGVRRLLIVEEEQVLRDLLAQSLAEAGYEVDTLSSGNGISRDIVGLINPELVLIDPFLADMPIASVARVLAKLHSELGFKLLLIDGGRDPKRLAQVAAACDADGTITKRDLLQAPADAVAERLLPEAEVNTQTSGNDSEGIEIPIQPAPAPIEFEIDVELTPEPPAPRAPRKPPTNLRPAPAAAKSATKPPDAPVVTVNKSKPPPPPPTAAPRPKSKAASGQKLLDMIEEEIVDLDKAPPKQPEAMQISISLLSRHNLYVGATGDLRTGGVFVAAEPAHAVGVPVQVRIEVPFVPPIETTAKVEWLRPGEARYHGRAAVGCYGLSLAHLAEKQRQALEGFFTERAPFKHVTTTVPKPPT